jgi:hypothetical protein
MEEPKSTVDNSLRWRIWHAANYNVGGVGFLIGSVLLYPFLSKVNVLNVMSAWLYTIGSFTFVLADSTECMHYMYRDCRFFWFALNFAVNVIGSFIYYVGSACFLPQINQSDLGVDFFILGSSFIIVAQSWKLLRTFCQPGKSFNEIYEEDPSGVWVDILAGVGAMGYFSGSFFFERSTAHPVMAYYGATLYTLGGCMFMISGIVMQKRYFWEKKDSPTLMD